LGCFVFHQTALVSAFVFRSLYKAENGAELARETFLQHKSFYHPIAATMIAKDLGLAK